MLNRRDDLIIARLSNERPRSLGPLVERELGIRIPEQVVSAAWSAIVLGEVSATTFVSDHEDQLSSWRVTREGAGRVFEVALETRRRQWAALPDDAVSNLDAAFLALESRGIIARQDFWCCQVCADSAIADECDGSRLWRGFVYFTEQDTADLIDSRSTCLSYGAFVGAFHTREEWDDMDLDTKHREYAEHVREVVRDVREVMADRGIRVRWSGDLDDRIVLERADYLVRV